MNIRRLNLDGQTSEALRLNEAERRPMKALVNLSSEGSAQTRGGFPTAHSLKATSALPAEHWQCRAKQYKPAAAGWPGSTGRHPPDEARLAA